MIRDSLGGILTNGLLGNMIISTYNLSIFNIIDIELQRPLRGVLGVSEDNQKSSKIIFKIKMFGTEYSKLYNTDDKTINILMRLITFGGKIKKMLVNIKFRINQEDLQVKIHEKNRFRQRNII